MNLRILVLSLLVAATARAQDPQAARGKELREPNWPQRFEVQGNEPAAFGFAVTRPGPIQLDVQWQGPPLIVELLGPQRLEQAGAGRLVMRYVATPEDVQRSPFWSVRVSLQASSSQKAKGTIGVLRPPVDMALLQSRLRMNETRRAKQGRPPDPSRTTGNAAAFERALQARVAKVEAEQAGRRAEAMRQFEAAVGRLSGGQVSSRAVEPQTNASAARSEILRNEAMRNETRNEIARQSAPTPEPPAQTQPLAPPVEVAPPAITGLAPASGQPGAPVLITGSGFGATRGEVRFVLNPGREVVAQIDEWSDGVIKARVPGAKCLVPAQASVHVVARGTPSAGQSYGFTPPIAARTAVFDYGTPGMTIASPGGVYPSASLWYVHPFNARAAVKHQSNVPFFGHKDTDVFLQGVMLTNGWVLEDVQLATFWWNTGTSADAYVSSFSKGSSTPVIQVRWWTNPFDPFTMWDGPKVAYTFAAVIKGPADMPDGLVSGTACG